MHDRSIFFFSLEKNSIYDSKQKYTRRIKDSYKNSLLKRKKNCIEFEISPIRRFLSLKNIKILILYKRYFFTLETDTVYSQVQQIPAVLFFFYDPDFPGTIHW